MKELFFNTIQEFNDYIGVKTLHPLVSVVRVENASPIQEAVHHYGLYALFLKENKGCKLSYGRTEYDFDEMTVTSFAPGQSIKVEPNPGVQLAKYTVLAFHLGSSTTIWFSFVCQIYGIGFPSRVAQPHPAWQDHLPL